MGISHQDSGGYVSNNTILINSSFTWANNAENQFNQNRTMVLSLPSRKFSVEWIRKDWINIFVLD